MAAPKTPLATSNAACANAACPRTCRKSATACEAASAAASMTSRASRGISSQFAATNVSADSTSMTAPSMTNTCGSAKPPRLEARSARIAEAASASIHPLSTQRATSASALSTYRDTPTPSVTATRATLYPWRALRYCLSCTTSMAECWQCARPGVTAAKTLETPAMNKSGLAAGKTAQRQARSTVRAPGCGWSCAC